MNYQPDSDFFATASHSHLHTTLDTPSGFYNFPAYAGLNVDGAVTTIAYTPNQTFEDPGVPRHLFNILANRKHESGFLDIAGTNANAEGEGFPQSLGAGGIVPASVVGANGYYKSPTISWQYTMNTAGFFSFEEKYPVKFTIYNLTSRRNPQNDYPFYGNDFLTRVPPRSFDLTLSGKF